MASLQRGFQRDLVFLFACSVLDRERVLGTAFGALEREVSDARTRLIAELGQAVGQRLVLGFGREPGVLPAQRNLAVDGAEALRALRREVRVRVAFDVTVQGLDDAPIGRLAIEGEAPDFRFRRLGRRPERQRGEPRRCRCEDAYAHAVLHVLHQPLSPIRWPPD